MACKTMHYLTKLSIHDQRLVIDLYNQTCY